MTGIVCAALWIVGTLLMIGVIPAIAVGISLYKWLKTENPPQRKPKLVPDHWHVFHEEPWQ